MGMSDFDVFQVYLSVKLHFSKESFDGTKFTKTNVKYSAYKKRPDKKFFEFISKRFQDNEIRSFFIAQFVDNSEYYIIDLIDTLDESISTFRNWKRRMSRVLYTFEKECMTIQSFMIDNNISFDNLFKPNKKKYPIIMRLMMEKFISLETYIMLEKLFTMSVQYDKMYVNDHIYDQQSLRIDKYQYYFKHIDIIPYRQVMKDIFIENS